MSDQQLEKYFKIAVGSLLILFFGFLANPLHGSGSAKLGGTFINSDSASVNGSLDYQWEMDKWQQTLETDYVYKEEDNEEILNEFVINTKSNYTFAPKQYVFGIVGYDYDKFRADGDRKVLGIGYGYKLLRTERIKVSNEFSLATLQTDSINEMIYRNSLWFSLKIVDRVTFTNKFLYEEGSESDVYIRNETALNYTFDNGILFGLSNTYTEDPIDTNVLSFNVGVKW
tara:strand:+ start:6795 stop:7478 length:684 start_codon:yes stop_codon:yes gene_type:complete